VAPRVAVAVDSVEEANAAVDRVAEHQPDAVKIVIDEIPLGARIIAVADVYDALTSSRHYRAALSHATALEHITSAAGLTLDEDAVSVFVGLIQTLSTAKPDVGARSALRSSG